MARTSDLAPKTKLTTKLAMEDIPTLMVHRHTSLLTVAEVTIRASIVVCETDFA